jgi:hypothetical protein
MIFRAPTLDGFTTLHCPGESFFIGHTIGRLPMPADETLLA